MTRIAFIGLGNMGSPMAQNLVKAGLQVSVYDLVTASVEAMAAAGATAAPTVGAAVKEADIVFTMLPTTEHTQKVYLAKDGVINSAKAGALLVDCSTINADISREVAKAAKQKGFEMLDAPVSGGTAGAANATLTFIVGGSKEGLERVRPVLEKMGKNIFHAGDSGAGQMAKICNNMLLAIHMIGTAEALSLGAAAGLDPKVLSEIMSKSSGRNWSLEVYNPCPGVMENVPASRGYTGGFGTDLMLKDLGLAQEAAAATQVSTPLGKKAQELYAQHSKAGSGKLDFSSIMAFINKALKAA